MTGTPGPAHTVHWPKPTFYALSVLPALFSLAIGAITGGALHVDDIWVTVIFGLGLVNLLVSRLHARALFDIRKPRQNLAADRETLKRLPTRCAWSTCVSTGLFLGGHHVLSHQSPVLWPESVFASSFVLIGVYSALIGITQFFFVGAFAAVLRRQAGWTETSDRSIHSGLGQRLVTTVAIASVLPLALVLVHREASVGHPPDHLSHFEMYVGLDVGAALLILVAAATFFTFTISKPVDELLNCMARFKHGEAGARAVVVTDDEIGALAVEFNSMAEVIEERDFIQQSLGRFVPETVASAVRLDRGVVRPREAEATILYTDIVGFTRLCQGLDPLAIFGMLNEYFGSIGSCVRERGGVITQFQGDSILATFNLPVTDPGHAANAVRTANAIQRCVASRKFGAGFSLPTRVGVVTGRVVAGTVGDHAQIGYTVHGDAVNLAQRLEEANKRTGTQVLVSSRTADLLGPEFGLNALEPVMVPGFTERVKVYTVGE